MAKSQDFLLDELFRYYVAVRFRCGEVTILEFEEKLGTRHVDALLHFAHQIQCKLEARGAAALAGNVQ